MLETHNRAEHFLPARDAGDVALDHRLRQLTGRGGGPSPTHGPRPICLVGDPPMDIMHFLQDVGIFFVLFFAALSAFLLVLLLRS